MPTHLIHVLLMDVWQPLVSNIGSILLVILFFGGSIFVHELGHFLAARLCGVHVERFSIGFGPAIWSRRGKDGVDYRISWLPLGGYVLLPQLADLGGVEGSSKADLAALGPVRYGPKMIVFAAGAAFNILFAFALACIVWVAGEPVSSEMATTRIGYLSRTLPLPDGSTIPSPALQAGLQVGDVIRTIDGQVVSDWSEVMQAIVAGSGMDAGGGRRTVFEVERGGRLLAVTVHPRISGEEQNRRVGIGPGYDLIVEKVVPGSAADRAGLRPGDRIGRLNGAVILSVDAFADAIGTEAHAAAALGVVRGGAAVLIHFQPLRDVREDPGVEFSSGYRLDHPSPFSQVREQFVITYRNLRGFLSPHSDLGLSKASGPVGIVHMFHEAAEAGIRVVLGFAILINVNLAIFNLLPIPVLDGGQMLFATTAWIRGRALPVNFVAATQGVFVVLLLGVMAYLTVFDTQRWVREDRAAARAALAAAPAAAAPVPAAFPAAGPAAARP